MLYQYSKPTVTVKSGVYLVLIFKRFCRFSPPLRLERGGGRSARWCSCCLGYDDSCNFHRWRNKHEKDWERQAVRRFRQSPPKKASWHTTNLYTEEEYFTTTKVLTAWRRPGCLYPNNHHDNMGQQMQAWKAALSELGAISGGKVGQVCPREVEIKCTHLQKKNRYLPSSTSWSGCECVHWREVLE